MADIDTIIRDFTPDFAAVSLDLSLPTRRTGYYEAGPNIDLVSVSSAPIGTSPLAFSLTGESFRPNGTCSIGADYSCTVTYVNEFQVNVSCTLVTTPVRGIHLVQYSNPGSVFPQDTTAPTGIDILDPVLTLTSSSVTSAPMGTSPIAFTLTGTGFDPGIFTSIGAEYTCVTTYVSPTSATVVATLTGSPVAGARLLQVSQPDGQSAILSTVFDITNPTLTLTSSTVTSATLGQTPINFTLTGTGFDAGMTVSIGAEYSCAVTVLGPTSATVVATLIGTPVAGARVMSATNPAPDSQTAHLGTAFVVAVGTSNPVATDVFPPTTTRLLKSTPVSFSVTDADNNLLRVLVAARFFGVQPNEEVVFDGQGFQPLYSNSVRTSIPGGFRYTIVRDGGWPGGPTFRIYAVDSSAREL